MKFKSEVKDKIRRVMERNVEDKRRWRKTRMKQRRHTSEKKWTKREMRKMKMMKTRRQTERFKLQEVPDLSSLISVKKRSGI